MDIGAGGTLIKCPLCLYPKWTDGRRLLRYLRLFDLQPRIWETVLSPITPMTQYSVYCIGAKEYIKAGGYGKEIGRAHV